MFVYACTHLISKIHFLCATCTTTESMIKRLEGDRNGWAKASSDTSNLVSNSASI